MMRVRQFARVVALGALAGLLAAGCAYTARVSVDSNAVQGNGNVVGAPSISDDGRYVAFQSAATNMVAGDSNNANDIFLRDTVEQKTTRISVTTAGVQANGQSRNAVISGSGRFIAFISAASNLVSGDTNNTWDVFVRDRMTGTTTRADLGVGGAQANRGVDSTASPAIADNGRYVAFASLSNLVALNTGVSEEIYVRDTTTGTTSLASVGIGGAVTSALGSPSISADGRYVAFQSTAKNLVPGVTNGNFNVFVRDMTAQTTTIASVNSAEEQQSGGTGGAARPVISGDGRFVAFQSLATNLVPGDTNTGYDDFLRDTQLGTTTRVNVSSTGVQAAGGPNCASAISADGRYVAFDSDANNLIAGDTNGVPDVFVRDTKLSKTTRVSVDQMGAQSSGGFSTCATISGDGRYIAFASIASNIVAGETNAYWDDFVRANPLPTLSSASPSSVARGGAPKTVTVSGTHFLAGVNAYFGDKITVTGVTLVDENTVKFTIVVDASAATGARNVIVYNAGTGEGPLTGAAAQFSLNVT